MKKFEIVTFMKQRCVIILINGTSGAGKSTIASQLGKLFQIRNVFSTDFIRSMMRNFTSKAENSLLHASTFETGYHLDPSDVENISQYVEKSDKYGSKLTAEEKMLIVGEIGCVKGYEDQCKMLEDNIMKFIDKQYKQNRTTIVEGVHVSESLVNRCMEKYDYVVPLFIYVENADDHLKRFSNRCKGASVDPKVNRYAKNFKHIRAIQKAIVKNTLTNKFIKTDNSDSIRTYKLLGKCIRRYIKKINEVSGIGHQKIAVNRKCNILNEVFKKAQKIATKINEEAKVQMSDRDQIWSLLMSSNIRNLLFCRKNGVQKQWFLKHEKIFHDRTKKYRLVDFSGVKRHKSAKKCKKNYNPISVDKFSIGIKKPKFSRKQRSIIEKIQSANTKATKSKVSESTACTINRVMA